MTSWSALSEIKSTLQENPGISLMPFRASSPSAPHAYAPLRASGSHRNLSKISSVGLAKENTLTNSDMKIVIYLESREMGPADRERHRRHLPVDPRLIAFVRALAKLMAKLDDAREAARKFPGRNCE
jgi:hypothetical protein